MDEVLIKMKMPTSCSVCQMLEGDRMDGLCHAASKWLDDDEYWTWYVYPEGDIDDSKPCNCPLVPVLPHGDLIDRDALKEAICSRLCIKSEKYLSPGEATIVNEIFVAPTIIPASEEEMK